MITNELVSSQSAPVTADDKLPRELRDKDRFLYKMALGIADYKDLSASNPDATRYWKGMVMGFQTLIKTICPNYQRFTGEDFSTTCDSGRNGNYYRGIEACHACKFLDEGHALTKQQLAQVVAARDVVPLAEIVKAQSSTSYSLDPFVTVAQAEQASTSDDPAVMRQAIQTAIAEIRRLRAAR